MSRVLLVEDHVMNRMLVRELLEHRGHEIVDAHNVLEARLRLSDAPFDVALVDIQIPGGSGVAVLEYIRATPHLAKLPVIAVTAQAMSGDRERLLETGFDGYISKPIDTKTFCTTVEEHIARAKT
jgi:two-component system cell cycle response regulator DivK